MLSNEEFMKILKKASKCETVEEMDKYLNNALYDKMPYDLTFKEVKQ